MSDDGVTIGEVARTLTDVTRRIEISLAAIAGEYLTRREAEQAMTQLATRITALEDRNRSSLEWRTWLVRMFVTALIGGLVTALVFLLVEHGRH